MKKLIASIAILLSMVSATLYLKYRVSENSIDIQCYATFKKNITSGLYSDGNISIHLFSNHHGIANVVGKMTSGEEVYTINREIGFIYDIIDIRKGVFKMGGDYFKVLSRDNMPSRYDDDINLNSSSKKSDYLIIRKINKNTWLFSSPINPIMLCVEV